jgi:AcrR family transcriptional regulator
MGRTTGRDADETRRQIIEAAARLISRRGSAVPISAIADAAGVSKGGLLYHFASKDELLEAVAGRLFDSFRDAVHDAASEDPDPGRLTRAYVRVSFADVADEAAAREMIAVAAQLMHEPRIQQIAAEDGARWREDLFGDGLDPAVVRIVLTSTDGVSAAPLWGTVLTSGDVAALAAQLLALASAPVADA